MVYVRAVTDSTALKLKIVRANDELVHRPIFRSHPTAQILQEFQDWIKRTGQPETFPYISMSEPPKSTPLSILSEPFRVDRKLRPGGDMVPCPVCQPSAGKFIEGYLVWCPASAAIYAIGVDCGAKHFGQEEYSKAEAERRRISRQRQIEDELLQRLPHVPAAIEWAKAWKPVAEESDCLARGFRKECGLLHQALQRAHQAGGELSVHVRGILPTAPAVTGTEVLHRLQGGMWLVGNRPELGRRFNGLIAQLPSLDFGNDADDVCMRLANWGPSDLATGHKFLRAWLKDVSYLQPRLAAARDFFDLDNLEGVERWANHPQINMRVRIQRTSAAVTVSIGPSGYNWHGKVREISRLHLLPSVPAGLSSGR